MDKILFWIFIHETGGLVTENIFFALNYGSRKDVLFWIKPEYASLEKGPLFLIFMDCEIVLANFTDLALHKNAITQLEFQFVASQILLIRFKLELSARCVIDEIENHLNLSLK